MNTFKVTLHEDKDNHFKIALKAFDKDAVVIYNDAEKYYNVTTTLPIEDLKSFTSVSNVENIIKIDTNITSGSWAQSHGYNYGHGGGRADTGSYPGLSFTISESEFLERYT